LVTPYSADNKSVSWKSNDVSVATVSQSGLVTAIAEGETQIVVTTNDGDFSETVSVMVSHGSPKGDSIALVHLHQIAYNLPDWDFSKQMEKWEGVVLNENRRVVEINSYYYDNLIIITKPLNASIGNLTCLEYLALSPYYYDDIKTFIIPPEIGKLKKLRFLCLVYGFTGTISPELGNLTNLECLIITENQVTGAIPQELENLKKLNYLYLNYNSLSGKIPQSLLDKFGADSFCPQYGVGFDNLNCSGY
jgi:hypothetical protein